MAGTVSCPEELVIEFHEPRGRCLAVDSEPCTFVFYGGHPGSGKGLFTTQTLHTNGAKEPLKRLRPLPPTCGDDRYLGYYCPKTIVLILCALSMGGGLPGCAPAVRRKGV